MDLNKHQHCGGVKSVTHATCLVAEPITVTIEGHTTSLSLADARALAAGIAEGVARVEAHETALKGDGNTWNLGIIASAGTGMSFQRSKLGDGQGIAFFGATQPLTDYEHLGPEVVDSTLANCNTKFFLRCAPEKETT